MSVEISIKLSRLERQRIAFLNQGTSREFRLAVLVSICHLPLGLLLYNAGPLAILHPLLSFGLGLVLAMKRQVPLVNVAFVAAYVIGAEVLWRMAGIPIYWESGKYMSAAIMTVALLRRQKLQIPLVPASYFLLLIPGCLVIITGSNLSRLVETLSFNMSGPMLVGVSCWFFQHLRLRPYELKRLLIIFIVPLLSVAFTTLFYTVSTEDLRFTQESNLATSGGFGPNQVSAMLGLGAFLSLAGFVLFDKHSRFRAFFALTALFMAALSVLTFSRGGIYNAVGAGMILILFQFRNLSKGVKSVAPVLILGIIFVLFIFPYLNSFTGGALEDRFQDTGTTNRWEILEADIKVFWENPLYGVGVGESREMRRQFLESSGLSHTEFSRLLSEHGLFGLTALGLLAVLVATNLLRPNSRTGKAFIAGAISWSFLFMMNAGMRLAAPSFMLGLAYVTIVNLRPKPRNIDPMQRISPTTAEIDSKPRRARTFR